jgi:acetyl-CoA carboxylase biotin carboxyl carrier protein
MSLDLKQIERLLELAKKYKLTEFHAEDSKLKVQFKFRSKDGALTALPGVVAPLPQPVLAPPRPAAVATVTAPPARPAVAEGSHQVTSPFVGTFYRAASPEADNYVKEGQSVRKGDILCIVEAMKLMNEIECDVSGKIVSILVENGQPVEYGEPLFIVDPM